MIEKNRVGCIGCRRVYEVEGKEAVLVKDDKYDCRTCSYLLEAVTEVKLEDQPWPERVGEIPHCKTCTCGDYFKD